MTMKRKKLGPGKEISLYNPPYNMMARENIGAVFTKTLKNAFEKGNSLAKVFNNHTIKLSYSTMPSMAMKIKAHNNQIKSNNENNENTKKDYVTAPKLKGEKSSNVSGGNMPKGRPHLLMHMGKHNKKLEIHWTHQ